MFVMLYDNKQRDTCMERILKKDKTYTFSDYFELNYSTKDVLEEFGYAYRYYLIYTRSLPF